VISFTLQGAELARLTIFDIRGEKVVELANGVFTAGHHELIWDGRDGSGRAVASGSYLCHLQAGNRQSTDQLLLVR